MNQVEERMNQAQRTSPADQRLDRSQGRPRAVIPICYACVLLLGVLLISGAPLTSLLLTLHGGKELTGLAGSYSVVLLEQKEIQRRAEELVGQYQFDPSLLQREADAAALSRFSQQTMEYWYGLAHGNPGGRAPSWDTTSLAKPLGEDAAFRDRWESQGPEKMAAEAAKKLGTSIENAVFPMKRLPVTLGLGLFSSQGFLKKALYGSVALLIAAALLLLAIRLLQRHRPYQSLWFSGAGTLTGALGTGVILLKLRNVPLEAMLAKHSPVLAYYGSAIFARFRALLASFGFAYALGGAMLLILFFGLRYQWMRSSHPELASFF